VITPDIDYMYNKEETESRNDREDSEQIQDEVYNEWMNTKVWSSLLTFIIIIIILVKMLLSLKQLCYISFSLSCKAVLFFLRTINLTSIFF
jgi:hypothetical protein